MLRSSHQAILKPFQSLGTGLPRSVKSQGKTKFFQGQGKVSEFCIWSGKFRISAQSQGKVREIYIILDIIRFSFKFIERLNKITENYAKHVMFSVQIAELKVSEILL